MEKEEKENVFQTNKDRCVIFPNLKQDLEMSGELSGSAETSEIYNHVPPQENWTLGTGLVSFHKDAHASG